MSRRKLPPDPEGMNAGRAKYSGDALLSYRKDTGTDRADMLSDFLGDIMHWCDRNNQSFDHELERARKYYKEETEPPAMVNIVRPHKK